MLLFSQLQECMACAERLDELRQELVSVLCMKKKKKLSKNTDSFETAIQ